MTLHRVTVAAFAVLLVLSGIGTLMARQGPQPTVQSVQLTQDRAESLPAVGGQVELAVPYVPAPQETIATAPPEPVEVVVEEPFPVLTAGAQEVSAGVDSADAPAEDDDEDDDGDGDGDGDGDD